MTAWSFGNARGLGERSAPLVICGAALPTREFRDGDLDGFVVACNDGVLGHEEPGKAGGGTNPTEPPKPMLGSGDAEPKVIESYSRLVAS